MDLPDLNTYRNNLINEGAVYPLQTIRNSENGLLAQLPLINNKFGWPWNEETNPTIYEHRKNWPKITIVTPSYNQANFIEQTLRSVLLQNYPNLEYIVIDGGSTDNSKTIIEKYAPWISYWQSNKDSGQGNAINQGFSIASGDYYAWVNSDDYYLPNVFNKVVTTFLKTNSKFIYGYGYNCHSDKDRFELVKLLPIFDIFLKIPNIIQPSTFWSSSIHTPIWEELNCALDFELWIRLVKGEKRKLIKQVLSVANVHNDAKTYDPKMEVKWQEDHEILWSENGHGAVPYWKYQNFLYRVYKKLMQFAKQY